MVKREAMRIKKLFDGASSRLWSEYSYKDRAYTISDIVKDILKLAPFGDKRHFTLVKFVEKQMDVTLWDRDHYRWTKPYRGSIRNLLSEEFRRQRKKRVSSKKQKTQDTKIKNIDEKFGLELVEVIYENDTPRTDSPHQHDISVYNRRVLYHEYEGKYKLIEGKPKKVLTFKEIAYPMRDRYLQEHTDVPKQKLFKALQLRIKEVSKYIYPNRKDTHPIYDYEDDIE